jgi:hypothetical protein
MAKESKSAVASATEPIPAEWLKNWGEPSRSLELQLSELRECMEALAADLTFIDRTAEFSDMVGSADIRNHPVHRWYYYKEGFSPRLPRLLVDQIGAGTTKTVVDPFAGIGTTGLSLRSHPAVETAIGVDYSPFASFVGKAKLDALALDTSSLQRHIKRLANFPIPTIKQNIPTLAAFSNAEIFSPATVNQLLTVRDLVRNDCYLSDGEQRFLLLGVAAIIEDVSTAMKDGRALRILKGRKRRRQGLRPVAEAIDDDGVHAAVLNQWRAMLEDLVLLSDDQLTTKVVHIRGDARSLADVKDSHGNEIIRDGSVGLYLYSPPYLNFLDYTEVYKLELWFLEMVRGQDEFRTLREGTLRSHPSIQFPEKPRINVGAKVFTVIDTMTEFLTANLARPSVGKTPGYYFEDMYAAFQEQFRTLERGGAIACVVANSTLSRRTRQGQERVEVWRMPVLTDVILARLAEAAGFVDTEIWTARALRAKNVNGGIARESIIVARKPLS